MRGRVLRGQPRKFSRPANGLVLSEKSYSPMELPVELSHRAGQLLPAHCYTTAAEWQPCAAAPSQLGRGRSFLLSLHLPGRPYYIPGNRCSNLLSYPVTTVQAHGNAPLGGQHTWDRGTDPSQP